MSISINWEKITPIDCSRSYFLLHMPPSVNSRVDAQYVKQRRPLSELHFSKYIKIFVHLQFTTLRVELLSCVVSVSIIKASYSSKNKEVLHFLLTVPGINNVAVTRYSIPSAVRSTQQSSWRPPSWLSCCCSPSPLTNQNSEENKSILESGNTCYNLVRIFCLPFWYPKI